MKDESPRFLRGVLDVWASFSDEILILDDNSTDDSREVALRVGAHVSRRFPGERAWGTEAPARAQLWNLAWNAAEEGDYILILDADMVPARNPRILMETGADSVFFALFDLWNMSPLTYREDGFWQGHLHPRLWMVRKRATSLSWRWPDRGIHCGHVPLNYPLGSVAFAPQEFSLLHYAYATPALRAEKRERYLSISPQLSPGEIAHARSITDPKPATYALPFTPEYTLHGPSSDS